MNLNHSIFEQDEYEWPNGKPNYKKEDYQKEQWLKDVKGNGTFLLFYASPEKGVENSYIKEFRLFYQKDNQWHVSWNLSKGIRDAFLTSAIVDAFRETSKQLKINSYSWYGKLIKQIWEKSKCKVVTDSGCTYEQALNKQFEQIAELTDGIFSDVAGHIQEKIDISFDGTKISFQLTADNKADIHKTTQVYVDDGFKSLLTDKGSGIQSAVVINLFSYYCHTFHNNTSLLVIEEPELYLHPQARRALAQKLENFIGLKPDKENQVIVTTHSSEFIAADKCNGITIVRKENGETKAKHYNFKGIDPKELKTLLKSENNEMFFADKVILVEGAEKYLMPIIADIVTNERNALDNKNISVIRAGGKHEFPKYMKILKECQIDYYILADRDCFFNGLKAIFVEEIGVSQDEKQEMLKFAKEVVDKSPKEYKNMQKVKEKTTDTEKSKDAKVLCDALASLETSQDKDTIEHLLRIWGHIQPQIMEKDVDAYMREHKLYKQFLNYRKRLIESNLFILKKGELED
ncbi:AAA family ATPase [Candidatus Roizmanbacteria bacterium]|nr:AAA family ATPase [Candidatus Roizmanbacteria bacterium]